MIHFINLMVQWVTQDRLPPINISWWLDAPFTLAAIILLVILLYYADKSVQKLQEREKAIDELIESHKR